MTAEEGFGGVRPSSGAASLEHAGAPDSITAPSFSNIAAPEDGRTPKPSPPPSLTHYHYLHYLVDPAGIIANRKKERLGR
jgi:hypothetical protein